MKKWLFSLIMMFTASVVTMQAQTYCTTGLYTSGCQYGDNLNDVTIGTLVQTATGCTGTGYADYTTDTISVAQTEPTTLSVTSGYSSQWYALYVDGNDDGDFADAGEFLWNSTVASGNVGTVTTGSFVIPTSVLVGNHRLRLRGHYAGSAFTATESCSSFSYGETHDYIVKVLVPPVCPAPYGGFVTATSAYSSTLHWVSTGTAFSIEYGALGFTPGSGTTVTSTTDSIVLTGLNPATTYTYYIQNNCTASSNGLSNWSGAFNFTTGCAPFLAPFTEDFDNTPVGSSVNPSTPQCWSYYETPGHTGYGYTYQYSIPNSLPNHFYMYNSSNITDSMLLISPPIIGLDSSNKQVVFWAKSNNASYSSPVVVGTMSDPSDASTFHTIGTVQAGQNYSEFTVQIDAANGYNGTDQYIAFLYKSPVTYRYLYFDDITIEAIPACPKPLFITLGTTTSTTQPISWTSAGTSFSLEWGPAGFTQGTGLSGTSSTTSYTMTGLSPNTVYDVYIQNNCSGAGNGLSVWAGPVTFKTECLPFVGAFTENFETTTAGTTVLPNAPDCWKYSTTTHGGYGYGYTRNYAAYAHSGTQEWYMYHSNTTDTMGLVTPAIAGMDTADKHIQFWARAAYSGTSYNEHIIVGTLSDPTDMSTMTAIDTVLIAGTTYQFFDVYLDAANGYNGTDLYIVMAAWTGSSTYGYFIIDDINVADVPQCTPSTALAVGNVTNIGADLSWLAGDGLAYNIEYGPTGFVQGTGPIVTGITGTSYSLTGLSGNTCYDVYVRDSCALANSPWYGPITFCTACNPIATPIVEDFETAPLGSSVNPTAPDCWTNWESPNASGYGYVYNYGTPNGTQHFYMYNFNSATDTIALISPAVAGLTNGDKVLKFKAKSNSTTSGTWAIVGTSASSQDLKNSTILDTIYTASQYGSDYTVHLDAASGYNGTDQYVFIMHTGAAPYYYLYLDDISITNVPTCAAPWNLGLSAITSNSATTTFNNLTGTSFQIEYGPTGFIPGTGLATTVNNVTPPYTITGLTPNTYYDYYASDMCDTTLQAGPFTFKTDCTAQLSGAYTIGGTPGATNFATLDSALSVLVGCGVSGPVTFNLQGGTQSASVMMNSIQGASATNTVTFNGMGVAMDTIDIPSGVTVGMNFNGTSYVTFKNITINADGTNRAIWFHEGAHHITFENCNILGTVSTSSLYATIVSSKTETSISSLGDNANDITIKGCYIEGGYYGVSFYGGGTAAYNMNLVFENNTIRNVYYYGLRVYYFDNVDIIENDIELTYTYSYAMYTYYTDNFNISGNTAMGGGYGLYCYYANRNITPAIRSTITNNFFGGANTYGLTLYYPNAINVHHNSARGGNRGLYVYGFQTASLETDVRNNIFYGAGGESVYFTNSQGGAITADYNLYFAGGTNIAYWKNAAASNLAALQAADTANNANSIQGDPGFISTTDFHITGTLPNDVADNSTGVVVDIDGDSRPASGSTTKDIGADEYTPLNWDASLEAIMVPMGGCGDSTTMVQAVVKNFGLNTITSLPITVSYSGGLTGSVSVTATVSIAQGVTDTVTVGTFNTYAGAAGVNFMAYSSLAGDQKSNNDTMTAGTGNYIPVEPVTHGMIDSVCASVDSVDLWAYYIPGTQYSWYDAAVGGNKIASYTDTVTVPTNGVTTYYVAYDSATATPTLGTGLLTSTGQVETPFSTYYMDGRHQYLILASELAAMGIAGGGEINALAFDVVTVGAPALTDFTIKIAGTSITAMTGSYQPTTSMTTVYSATYTTVSGWNNFVFTSPFIWNGADNILVEVCYDNNAWTSNSDVRYTTTTFPSVTGGYADLSASSGCTPGGITNQQVSSNRPDMKLNMKTIACSEVRKPVSFVVNGTPAVASAFTSTVNVNGADVDFDGSASTGDVYTWNFGDGTTGTGAMASHTYATAGTWTACLTVEDTVCGSMDSVCQTVITTIGLEESLLNQSLNVFPNPSNGKFRVEFQVEGLKNVTLRVSTLLGQEIYTSKPGNVSGEYREEIDLSTEATGVYVLQILTDDNVVSRRITIRK